MQYVQKRGRQDAYLYTTMSVHNDINQASAISSRRGPRLNLLIAFVTAFLIGTFGTTVFAGEVVVAAASDLSFPIKEIIAQFEKQNGHTVKLTLGSSGNFQAQIINGAPFDVYISADVDYVRQLEQRGLVEPKTMFVYAVGRLVMWVRNGSQIGRASCRERV